MLAGSIVRAGKIDLIQIDEPTLGNAPKETSGEIIFQPHVACLCGSDLPYFCQDHASYPLQPGLSLHEMVGTVVETSGKRFKKGDRVLAVPEGQVGLFERYAVDENRVIPLDPRKPPHIAMMAQPLGTILYALKKIPQFLDKDVVIVGQGPIGQLFAAALRNLGARHIIGIDPLASRLAKSAVMGATHVIDSSKQDPLEEVSRITNGRLADVVVEAVGHEDQALDLCGALCRHAGSILYFGVPDGGIHSATWRELFLKNIAIYTTVNPDFERDFPLAMQWISEGRIDVEPIITHTFPLDQIQTAFETFRDRVDGALKVQVDFPCDW